MGNVTLLLLGIAGALWIAFRLRQASLTASRKGLKSTSPHRTDALRPQQPSATPAQRNREDYLLDLFSRTAEHPFGEPRLYSRELANNLRLSPQDKQSLDKYRVSAISMALFVSFRSATEGFVFEFGTGTGGLDGFKSFLDKAAALFDAIVESHRVAAHLPSYVTGEYFPKWRRRYYEQVEQQRSIGIKRATLHMFLAQCTFTYDAEPSVAASQDALLAQGEAIYDNYVIALRNLIGQGVLR